MRRGRGPATLRASLPSVSSSAAAAAGSERLKKTQEPGAEGEELSRESMHINRSLSYLEQVGGRWGGRDALSSHKQRVPSLNTTRALIPPAVRRRADEPRAQPRAVPADEADERAEGCARGQLPHRLHRVPVA